MNLWEALTTTPEMERLDFVIRGHERLELRLSRLIDVLLEKQLITHNEAAKLRADEPVRAARQPQ